jgi:hypothetical protein
MKHIVVNTHNPESCAFRSDEDAAVVGAALDGFADAAAAEGVEVEAFWIDRAAHTFFIVVEAPNAHAVDAAVVRAGLVGRTHSDIHPVLSAEEVRQQI